MASVGSTSGLRNTIQEINSWVPSWSLRTLSDRTYERRKSAAQELETAVRKVKDQGHEEASEKVLHLIRYLTTDFICSTNLHQRKGGLIGLAAIGLGLGSSLNEYLPQLIQPILTCFDDPDTRVRYYACEALYNVTKSADERLLQYFNKIFSGVTKLFADVDSDVKNGAQILNELLLGFVSQHSKSLDLASFVPILQTFLRVSNPYVRQLLIEWIKALNASGGPDLLAHLPQLLDGLFSMLSDPNKEICQSADRLLQSFLVMIQKNDHNNSTNFSDLIVLLARQCESSQRYNRLTAMNWLHEFLSVAPSNVVDNLVEVILEAVLACVVDPEYDIRESAVSTHEQLVYIVRQHSGMKDNKLDWDALSQTIVTSFDHYLSSTGTEKDADRVSALSYRLRWLAAIIECAPDHMRNKLKVLAVLPNFVIYESEKVASLALAVMGRASRIQPGYIQNAIHEILLVASSQEQLPTSKLGIVVCHLSVLLPASCVYSLFAKELLSYKSNVNLVAAVVRLLTTTLYTSSELSQLRKQLLESANGDTLSQQRGSDLHDKDLEPLGTEELFKTMFDTWSFDPVSSVSLCLFTQEYELAWEVVSTFTELEINLDCLMELDRLVYQLETPTFLRLRLQLLESQPHFRPSLLKSLYGLLMVLPQGEAFKTLHSRLSAASGLHGAVGSGDSKGIHCTRFDNDTFTKLVTVYKQVQVFRNENKLTSLRSQQLPVSGLRSEET